MIRLLAMETDRQTLQDRLDRDRLDRERNGYIINWMSRPKVITLVPKFLNQRFFFIRWHNNFGDLSEF